MSEQPLISICHTTARPDGWQDSYRAWIERASQPDRIEYVLCVDRRWGFSDLPPFRWDPRLGELREGLDKACWNTGRKCLVDGANIAAANSAGKVIIVNSDDMFPAQNWDLELLSVIPDLDGDFAVRVSPGELYQAWLDNFVFNLGRDPIISRLMTLQILSRARYEKTGYAFYPEFTSMMADTDFTDSAECDGVVIEARHIEIEHRHPFVTAGASQDSVSKHENELAAHQLGARIYERRYAERRPALVGRVPGHTIPVELRKKVAVLLPAPAFDWRFVRAWSELLIHLAKNYDLSYTFQSCSNQHFVRDFAFQSMVKHVKESGQTPDYCLWIDSDNIPSVQGFELLRDQLDLHPEISSVGGWYWMDFDPICICARIREKDGTVRSITIDEVQRAYDAVSLIPINEHIGFGFILLRWELMASQGLWPFRALVNDKEDCPMCGDDVSFCRRAIEKGFNFWVHPEVFVEHLKVKPLPGPQLRRRTAEDEKQLAGSLDSFALRDAEGELVKL